ncbi:MAG: DUF624 domain-containing protein [Chloroflexi bacterium]|jgi:uncharacterized membrane protein YesL|uniref:DUF624 domain-containing protein n=1 Tax=Candidatus Thermofonsia Clade 3 bacterium TaxID=2364212 RepID=A0A2M8QBC6_9CHLR|nr:YesL family protein [Candidatus Roseilinea sp. NK_OTU-006]PJF47095.1 MAG: hypothetical protein CUN48_10425 [Candidatus Thermofonsia Clade 3 bacterium]RMG64226.1 MAG: DUF624 domain-containing protein [Chloroflexota bacterium]
MIDAFRVAVKTFKDIWGEMFTLVLMNVFTLLCLIVILPGPPAMMALYAVCNRIANDYAVTWEHYFAAFREHFRKAWLYALVAFVVTALLIFNFWWYGAMFDRAVWAQWVQGAWLAAMFFWVAINFYIGAFYVEQQDRRWRVALRNSALVAGASPLFTLTLLAIAGACMAVSLAMTPLFVLLGLSTWAMLGSEAVVDRVNRYRRRMEMQASVGAETQVHKHEA